MKLIQDEIKDIDFKPMDIPMENKKVETFKFENKRKKIKTIEDDRVYYGVLIEDSPVTISSIVLEDNNLVLECEIFGVDVFESSKSNFKIITLKITDYTDSMYAKIFLNDSEEFKEINRYFKSR